MELKCRDEIVQHLLAFQRRVRDVVMTPDQFGIRGQVERESDADTIYQIDAEAESLLGLCCGELAQIVSLVLIVEGSEPRVFPEGIHPDDAEIRLIVDPIDGTRGLMYDKRSAWSLAAAAPNKGKGTRLRDIEVAVMTELPTTKMGVGDVLWAIKNHGTHARRYDLRQDKSWELSVQPSQDGNIDHGYASVSSFFPGTKVLAAELMEHLARHLVTASDLTRARIFDDQYISTGGQFYELIVGHDRFIADLRPVFYRMNGQGEGLCCHPYDCAALLIAEEAGVIVTDEFGQPLDGPLNTTTGLSWIAYANAMLRSRIEPLIGEFLRQDARK